MQLTPGYLSQLVEGNQEMAKLSNTEITDDNISTEAIRPLLVSTANGIAQMKHNSSFTEQRVLAAPPAQTYSRYTGKPI